MTLAETRALLTVVADDRLAALFRLAVTLGLRQVEVLGQMWDDVNLDGRTLQVRRALQRTDRRLILKEPKSEKSRRTVALPPSSVAALRDHRTRQMQERLFAGGRWQDHGLVFAST